MKLRVFALTALLACAIPLVPWLMTFWSPSLATDQTKWSEFGSFIGGVLSPLLAFASFLGLLATIREQRASAERQKIETDDRNYFNHAIESLKRAYETLAGGQSALEPVRDRLAWLSCARLLLSAKEVANQISISSQGLLAVYDGESEHWRRRFYELLNPTTGGRVGTRLAFFSEQELTGGGPIEERSIRVIFEFMDWPEGRQDPIDSVPKYTLEDLSAMNASMSGIREYVRSKPRFCTPTRDA
jgi:hypothetical protein